MSPSAVRVLWATLAIVVLHSHPDPPIADWTAETQDFRRLITARQVVGKLARSMLFLKRPDLHCPAPAICQRCRSFQNLYPHHGNARSPNIDLLGGRLREIQDSTRDKWTTIGDAYDHRVSSLHIRDAHDAFQRQRSMSSGHGVHVINFAVRGLSLVVRTTVPTRETSLYKKWLRAGVVLVFVSLSVCCFRRSCRVRGCSARLSLCLLNRRWWRDSHFGLLLAATRAGQKG